ncbi:hypothetical protein ACQEVZ_40145 [Dactylosporangium sp. CA-152071]|uniref:hypothetical protein n=1 Tax=Dactylosporangium sp. CA-152071 TaxID=3239933 RepID=UPI003D8BF1ED
MEVVVPESGLALSLCPDRVAMPVPSGSVLGVGLVSRVVAVRVVRYALGWRAPQTGEVRLILAGAGLLGSPLLSRFLGQLPVSTRGVSFVDAVPVSVPGLGVVVEAANALGVPVEVGLGAVGGLDGFADGLGFGGGLFEFRDGLGSVPGVLADRVRVWPVDVVGEGVLSVEVVAGRVAERFGVVVGDAGVGVFGLGFGWVVQVFGWGFWVRPEGVGDGVVAGVVGDVVAGRVGAGRVRAGRAGRAGGGVVRPLVLLGVPGGGTAPDVVLERLEGLRGVLSRVVVARLWVEWLGGRPLPRVTELSDAERVELAGTVPGGVTELGGHAGSSGVGRRRLSGMLADFGVVGGDVTVGRVGELAPRWVALLLGGEVVHADGPLLASLLDLVEEGVDAAGFDRAGIVAVAGAAGVSTVLVSALSLRIGRVPVELVSADPGGWLIRLAAWLGVDPAVLPTDFSRPGVSGVSGVPGVVGPVDAARLAAVALRGDPVWSAAHPPEQELRVRLTQTVVQAFAFGSAADELGPFGEWLAGQGRDIDSLSLGMEAVEVQERLRRQWLAAVFLVPVEEIVEDEVIRPWLVYGAMWRLARRLGVAPQVVRQAAVMAEDLLADLDDLDEIGGRYGLSGAALWRLAFDLDLDPWALEPVLAGRTTFTAAAVRADLDRWSALLGVSDRIALAFLRDTRRTGTDLASTSIDDLDAWAAMILVPSRSADGWTVRGAREWLGPRYLDPVLWAADALTYTPGDLIRTAHASGVSPYWLAAASIRTGLPFTDLATIARKLAIDPPQFLAIAAHLSIIPDRLGGLLQDLQDDLPEWRSRLNSPQPHGDLYRAALALAEQLRPAASPRDPRRRNPGRRVFGDSGPGGLLKILPVVTADDRDVVSHAVREEYVSVLPVDASGKVRRRLWAHWARNWAPRLGQPVEIVEADLCRRHWLSPGAVEAAAAAIGGGIDPAEVWKFAVRFGRIPSDVHQLADQWGIEPSALFQIALTFDTDPRHLSPILSVYRPDQQRTLTDHITEWEAWFDEQREIRSDRGLLMTALHDHRMTIESATDTDELRDIVDSWIATTLGQSIEAFHELERTGPIDVRAGWGLMAGVTIRRHRTWSPFWTNDPEQLRYDWSYPLIAQRFGVSAEWLRGVVLRSDIKLDVTNWDASLPTTALPTTALPTTAQLALAADLGYLPTLSVEQTDQLREPGAWRATVREMAAAFPRGPRRDPQANLLRASSVAKTLALFATFQKLPRPFDWSRFNGLEQAIKHGLTDRPKGTDRSVIDGRDYDLLARSPQFWAAFAEEAVEATASPDLKLEAHLRLMDRFVDMLGRPWSDPGIPAGRTWRVVHAADAAGSDTHLAQLYVRRAIGLYAPGGWRGIHLQPAPESARLSRAALGLDRVAEVLDSAGWDRYTRWLREYGDTPLPRAQPYWKFLRDTGGLSIDSLLASLLAAYPGRSFVRFDGLQDDPGSVFDGVVRHLATTEGARGIVLYRTGTETMTRMGLINAFRGPSGAVLFVDPLTLSLAVLPTEGQVEVLFLPTDGAGPGTGVTRVDPRTDLAWPDPLRDHADALGINRLVLGQMFVDTGRTAEWSGDLKAARGVVDDWHTHVLGVTGVPVAAAGRIERLILQLFRLAGSSVETADEEARQHGVSASWFRATVLRAADGAFTPDLLVPAGRFASGQGPWAGVLSLLPYVGDLTDEQFEALRVGLADDDVAIASLPDAGRAPYAAAVLGDPQALATYLLSQVAPAGVAHASSGRANLTEQRLYLSRGGPQLPRRQDIVSTGNPLADVVALDEWRRGPVAGRLFPQLETLGIADLVQRYAGGGGFVRFLDEAGRPVIGVGGLVRHLAGTGDAGVVLYRALDGAGAPVERVMYAFDEQGTVILIDPVTLELADVDEDEADVLFLSTGGQATTGGRAEHVDAGADWAGSLAELLLPPLLLPDGVTKVVNKRGGSALVVDDSGERSPLWRNVRRLTGALPATFVIVDRPGDDEVLGGLKVLLERLRLRGQVPVVLTSRWTPALSGVRDQFGVAIVYQTVPPGGQSSLRLDNVWALTGARATEPEHHGATLALQILHDAEALVVPSPPVPRKLASWLDMWARGDREAWWNLLAVHPARLTSQAVLDWLAEMADRAPRGVNDAHVHGAVIRLARAQHTDLAYRFFTAPDAEARVAVTLAVEPQDLRDVTPQLADLGEAISAGPVDKANAAVLRALHEVLTKDSPKAEWFPATVIRNLTPPDRILWADRLSALTTLPNLGPNQQLALDDLRTLTLTC